MDNLNRVLVRFGFDRVRQPDLVAIPFGSMSEYLKVLEEKYSIDATTEPEATAPEVTEPVEEEVKDEEEEEHAEDDQ